MEKKIVMSVMERAAHYMQKIVDRKINFTTSKHKPHQGSKEMMRRRKQNKTGEFSYANRQED